MKHVVYLYFVKPVFLKVFWFNGFWFRLLISCILLYKKCFNIVKSYSLSQIQEDHGNGCSSKRSFCWHAGSFHVSVLERPTHECFVGSAGSWTSGFVSVAFDTSALMLSAVARHPQGSFHVGKQIKTGCFCFRLQRQKLRPIFSTGETFPTSDRLTRYEQNLLLIPKIFCVYASYDLDSKCTR